MSHRMHHYAPTQGVWFCMCMYVRVLDLLFNLPVIGLTGRILLLRLVVSLASILLIMAFGPGLVPHRPSTLELCTKCSGAGLLREPDRYRPPPGSPAWSPTARPRDCESGRPGPLPGQSALLTTSIVLHLFCPATPASGIQPGVPPPQSPEISEHGIWILKNGLLRCAACATSVAFVSISSR